MEVPLPRDGSNVYTLPEAPFTAGTAAVSATMNSNLSDIATEISDSVCRSTETTSTTRAFLLASTKAAARDALDAPGTILQTVYAEYKTAAALTAYIPYDNSIPQITEGTEILSVSITPKSATSRLRLTFNGAPSVESGGGYAVVAAFLNGASSAFAARGTYLSNGNAQGNMALIVEWVAGATSAQTISIRAGGEAQTLYFNGPTAGTARLGATQRATVTVDEIAA